MPREREPNTAPIRYDREQLLEVMREIRPSLFSTSAPQRMLDEYERRRAAGKDMPCQAVVHHGPGHQSSTHCQVVGGDAGHDHVDGAVQHYANLPSGGYAEWTDDDPFAEYWG